MTVAISQPADIAAASPLVSSEAVTNKGTGELTGLVNADMDNIPLATTITLTLSRQRRRFWPRF